MPGGPRTFHYCCRVSDRVSYPLRRFEAWVGRILRDPRGWARWGFRFVRHRAAPLVAGAGAGAGARAGVALRKQEASLRRRHRGQFFVIELEADEVIARYGKDFRGMSVANCADNHVSINFTRWQTGAKPTRTDRVRHMRRSHYRTYVILHEVGHILSKCDPGDHKSCTRGPAPVMLQQTNGVGTCHPNPWPVAGIDNVLAERARPDPARGGRRPLQ